MGYDEAIDYDNLRRAAKDCMKANRWKNSVQQYEIDMLQHVSQLYQDLHNGTYCPKPTVNFMLLERGKWRNIKAHHIIDRTWYKSWCEHDFKPYVEGKIMYANSASQKGKGTDHSIALFRQGLAKAYKKCGNDFYVGTTDYHDYFASISHDMIIKEVNFKDPRSEQALRDYLKVFPGDKGVGIGGEPSQVISIMYPSRVDRMVACNCPVIASGRYMDDSWFICRTKEEAQYTLSQVVKVSEELGLIINWKRTQIHNMKTQSVTWLKKRTSITSSGKIIMKLTRKNVKLRKQALDHFYKDVLQNQMPLRAVLESMQCWSRYALKYDGYKQVQRIVRYSSELFGIPDAISKDLMHRNTKGWLLKCIDANLI